CHAGGRVVAVGATAGGCRVVVVGGTVADRRLRPARIRVRDRRRVGRIRAADRHRAVVADIVGAGRISIDADGETAGLYADRAGAARVGDNAGAAETYVRTAA